MAFVIDDGMNTKERNKITKQFYNQQSVFFEQSLGIKLEPLGYLSENDAKSGRNFYASWPKLFDEVKFRHEFKDQKDLYTNPLSRQHLAYNFFVPLKHRKQEQKVLDFFFTFIPGFHADEILEFVIEYVPLLNFDVLNDNTLLDVFIRYKSRGKNCGIGFKIDFLEIDYEFDEIEEIRIFKFNGQSVYHETMNEAELYKNGAEDSLKTPQLKSLWLSHLLGSKMLLNGYMEKFAFVHLFPLENKFQRSYSDTYRMLLKKSQRDYFISLSFKDFIIKAYDTFSEEKVMLQWLNYLEKRYIG
jgi:hypothetical protein